MQHLHRLVTRDAHGGRHVRLDVLLQDGRDGVAQSVDREILGQAHPHPVLTKPPLESRLEYMDPLFCCSRSASRRNGREGDNGLENISILENRRFAAIRQRATLNVAEPASKLLRIAHLLENPRYAIFPMRFGAPQQLLIAHRTPGMVGRSRHSGRAKPGGRAPSRPTSSTIIGTARTALAGACRPCRASSASTTYRRAAAWGRLIYSIFPVSSNDAWERKSICCRRHVPFTVSAIC